MEDSIYVGAEEQTSFGEEKLDFRFIVMEHLRRIIKLSSVEWKGGYEVTNPRTGIETYIPDTRAEYWNAINALSDIMNPHLDNKIIEEEEKLNKEEKELFNEWHTRTKEGLPIPKYNDADEKYKDKKVILKRKLFRLLCKFLKKKGYFKVKEITDEDDE